MQLRIRSDRRRIGAVAMAIAAGLALSAPASASPAPTTSSTQRVAGPITVAYAQTSIRAWDGLYGVTGGWADPNGNLTIVSQDKYWLWSPSRGFYGNGFLGQSWGEGPPIVDLNPSGKLASRLQKRPWN